MSDTHFGFQTVDEAQKAQRVRGVFDSVASKYDVMNDLMSLGLHRAWKAYTVAVANLRPGDRVLDLAAGTGDLARAFARKVGPGTITITSRLEGGLAVIEVADDGLGISEERLAQAMSSGIGLSNVDERLRVIYGSDASIRLTSEPGRGTVARVELPINPPQERAVA